MKNLYRADTKKLTQLWDKGSLKDCYCLIFSLLYGFRIVWNDENGLPHRLAEKDSTSYVLSGFFVVLAVFESEEQARQHFSDYVKYAD